MKNILPLFLCLISIVSACGGSSSKKPDPADAPGGTLVGKTDQVIVDETAQALTEAAILGQNASKTTISTKLILEPEFQGIKIKWTSSLPAVIAATGTVQRPSASACPKGTVDVRLTAELSKAAALARKEFDVTVLCLPLNDQEAVAAATKALTAKEILGNNLSLAEVRWPLRLAKEGREGTTISWSSSKPETVKLDGTVVQDPLEKQTVDLVATIKKNVEQDSVKFSVTVLAQFSTPAEKLAADRIWLSQQNILKNNPDRTHIISPLELPVKGPYGSPIEWKSSSPAIQSNGVVTRPEALSPDQAVELTATLGLLDGPKVTFKFYLTVPAQDPTDQQKLDADSKLLTSDSIRKGNASLLAVTGDLNLKNQGLHGSTILWKSGNASVISPSGSVHRPAWDAASVSVELTAELSLGTLPVQTKTFSITVLPDAQTPDQAVEKDFEDALKKFLGQNTDGNAIHLPLELAQQGPYGSRIAWASVPPDRIDASGAVKLPNWNEAAAPVQLTLLVTKTGAANRSQTINLTLVPTATTDKDKVDADFDWLIKHQKELLRDNTAFSQVTSALRLPARGLVAGSSISWSPAPDTYVDPSGAIRRPKALEPNANVNLRYTIKSGLAEKTDKFTLTVLAEAPSDELAVEADFAALSDHQIKGDNESLAQVLQPLHLSNLGVYGSTISWTSVPAGIVDASGAINRPEWKQDERTLDVKLTATVGKGVVATKSRTFSLSVVRREANDEQTVAADQSVLKKESFLQGNLDSDHIRSDLVLPLKGSFGSDLVWSSNQAAIQASGHVVQPAFDSVPVPVTLKVVISKGSARAVQTFDFIVQPADPTGADKLKVDTDRLTYEFILNKQNKDQVAADINLPSVGLNGSSYKWTISESDVVSPSGHIVRPSWDMLDKKVILRVVVSRSDTSLTKSAEYVITVLKNLATNQQRIEGDLALLTNDAIRGENASLDEVRKNLLLPKLGTYGTQISWTANPAALIKESGLIQQPLYNQSAVPVTLTAALVLDGETRSKAFTVRILPADATDAEAIQETLNWLKDERILGQNTALTAVVSDLNLVKAGLYGAHIEWGSEAETTITTKGKIKQPKAGQADQTVQLTAYIWRDDNFEYVEKTFVAKVLAKLPDLTFTNGDQPLLPRDTIVLEPGEILRLTLRPSVGELLAYKMNCTGPAGLTFVNTQLTFDNAQAGTYTLVCSISRAGQSQSVTLQVVVNAKPKVSCSPADTYAPGENVRIPCTVVDAENDSVQLSLGESDCPDLKMEANGVISGPVTFHNCNVQVLARDNSHTLPVQIRIKVDPASLRFQDLKTQVAGTIGGVVNGLTVANGKIFAATNRGLWSSADSGGTWSVFSPSDEYKLGSAELNSVQVLGKTIVTWSTDYMSWSTDEGQTWHSTWFRFGNVSPMQRINRVVLTEHSILAQYLDEQYILSGWRKLDLNDSNEKWTSLERNFSQLQYENKVLLGWDSSKEGLFKSMDEGQTWTNVQNSLKLDTVHLDSDGQITMSWFTEIWSCSLDPCAPVKLESASTANSFNSAYRFFELNGFLFAQTSWGDVQYADKNNLRTWYRSSVYSGIRGFFAADNIFVGTKNGQLLIGDAAEIQKTVTTATDPGSSVVEDMVAFGGRLWMGTRSGLYSSTNKGESWTRSADWSKDNTVHLKVMNGLLLVTSYTRAIALDAGLKVVADTSASSSHLSWEYTIEDFSTDGTRFYVKASSSSGTHKIYYSEVGLWKEGLTSRGSGFQFDYSGFVVLDDKVYIVATKLNSASLGSARLGYLVPANSPDIISSDAINTSAFFPIPGSYETGVIQKVVKFSEGRSWVISKDSQWLERSAKAQYKSLGDKHASTSNHIVSDGREALALDFQVSKTPGTSNKIVGRIFKAGSSEIFNAGTLNFDAGLFDATGYFPTWTDKPASRDMIQSAALKSGGIFVGTERGLAISNDDSYNTWSTFGVESGLSCPYVSGVWVVDDQLFVQACGLHRVRLPN